MKICKCINFNLSRDLRDSASQEAKPYSASFTGVTLWMTAKMEVLDEKLKIEQDPDITIGGDGLHVQMEENPSTNLPPRWVLEWAF